MDIGSAVPYTNLTESPSKILKFHYSLSGALDSYPFPVPVKQLISGNFTFFGILPPISFTHWYELSIGLYKGN